MWNIDEEAHILRYLEANGDKHLYTYKIYHVHNLR